MKPSCSVGQFLHKFASDSLEEDWTRKMSIEWTLEWRNPFLADDGLIRMKISVQSRRLGQFGRIIPAFCASAFCATTLICLGSVTGLNSSWVSGSFRMKVKSEWRAGPISRSSWIKLRNGRRRPEWMDPLWMENHSVRFCWNNGDTFHCLVWKKRSSSFIWRHRWRQQHSCWFFGSPPDGAFSEEPAALLIFLFEQAKGVESLCSAASRKKNRKVFGPFSKADVVVYRPEGRNENGSRIVTGQEFQHVFVGQWSTFLHWDVYFWAARQTRSSTGRIFTEISF